MKKATAWLSTLLQQLWTAVALLLVVAAVVMSLVRLALPLAQQYTENLERYIQQQYGIDVTVGNIDAVWQDSGPVLILTNLQVNLNEQSGLNMNVDSLRGQLSFWRSMFNGQPIVDGVELAGMSVTVDVAKPREIDIADNSNRAIDTLSQLFLQQLDSFSVVDSRVVLTDADGDVEIDIPSLTWGNWRRGHRGVGQLKLQGISDNNLDFMVNLNGDKLSDLAGTFYLDAQEMDISAFITRWLPTSVPPNNTQLSFQFWANFQYGEIYSAQLQLRENRMSLALPETVDFALSSGVIRADKHAEDWHVKIIDVATQIAQGSTQMLNGTAKWSNTNRQLLHLNRGVIEPGAIRVLAQILDNSALAELAERQASAQLSDIHLYHQHDDLGLSIDIDEISMVPSGNQPGVPLLSGHLDWWNKQGRISLQGDNGVVDVGLLLPQDIAFDRIELDTYLDLEDGVSVFAPVVKLSSPELNIDTALSYNSAGKQLVLDSRIGQTSLATVKNLLPANFMSSNLNNYLNRALQKGKVENANILWAGSLDDFPFDDNNGVFQARVEMDLDAFLFSPTWPALTNLPLTLLFENKSLSFAADSGQMGAVELAGLSASIPQLGKKPNLYVSASSQGTGIAIGELMNASPLQNKVGKVLDNIIIKDQVDVDLELAIPLSGGMALAEGVVELTKSNIHFPAINLALDNVSGSIRFSNDVIKAPNLTGDLFGSPIDFNIAAKSKANGDYVTNANFSGDWKIKQVIQHNGIPLSDQLSGDLDWLGKLELVFVPGDLQYELQISSNLQGLGSTLPYPLAKLEEDKGLLFIDAEGDLKASSIRAIVNNSIKFNGLLPHDTKRMSRAHLSIGATDLMGLGAGFNVSVDLPQFDAGRWINQLSSISSATGNNETLMASVLGEPQRLFLNTDKMHLYGYQFDNLELTARPVKDYWSSSITSEQFDGRINFAKRWLQQGLVINADRANIAKPSSPGVTTSQSPKAPDYRNIVPPIQLQCADCALHGIQLGTVALRTQREAERLVIESLTVQQPYLDLQLSGEWSLLPNQSRSQLQGQARSKDIGVLLTQFDINTGLRDAGSVIDFTLAWDDAPFNIGLDSLDGNLSFDLDDGYLKEFNDQGSQVSRVLGLLSLKSLLRKLRFDFRDVFNKGFFFEDLSGSFVLDDGLAETSDFFIDGPGLDFSMNGSLNLATEVLDFNAGVIPNLTSSFPVLLWMLNPGVGLAGLAIDEAVKSAKVVSNIQYKIQGSLQEPVITELSRSTQQVEIPTKTPKTTDAKPVTEYTEPKQPEKK